MKIFVKIEFSVIIMLHFIAITVSEDLEIFRVRANGSDGWTKGKDTFKVPLSLCDQAGSDSMNCARFNAGVKSANGEKCLCSCANENATLMYNNDEWRCLKNSLVRYLLGYNPQTYIRFENEGTDNELRMLNISDYERVSLNWWWFNCRVIEGSSRYIGCDGSELPFSSSLFTIKREANQNYPYFLQVNSGISGADFLRGRIIKLDIRCNLNIKRKLLFKYEGKLTCSITTPTVQPSLTTKSLNVTLTSSPSTITRTTRHVGNDATTESPPTTSHVIPTASDIPRTDSVSSTTVSDTPSTGAKISSTVSDTPPTVPDILSTVFYTSPTVPAAPTTASDTSPTVTNVRPTVLDIASKTLPTTSETTTGFSSKIPARPSPGSERRTDDNSFSLPLLVGLSAAVLVVIFIVGFLVYRRRYSKQNPYSDSKCEEKKETVMMSSHTSSAYEPDDENAYKELNFREPAIYASHYQAPYRSSETNFTDSNPNADHVYAPLNISKEQNIYGHINTQEPVYRVLENPAYDNEVKSQAIGHPISIEQPVYDLMEELSVKGADNQPLYNVLDGLCLEGSEGPEHYGAKPFEEPFYNTLEESCVLRPDNDPGLINEPIYNVLEEEPYPEVSAEIDDYGSRNMQRPCV